MAGTTTKNSTRFMFFFAPIMRYLMTVVFSVKEVRNEKRLVDSEYIISWLHFDKISTR